MDANVNNLAKKIKGIIFDVDGVFTDNCEYIGLRDDSIIKKRNYYDGQGISLLRAIGIQIALVTNEKEKSAKAISDLVKRWNSLPSSKGASNPNGWSHIKLYTGVAGSQKIAALEQWISEIGIGISECAAMGDDMVDLPLLLKVPLRAAPISGEAAVRNIAHFVSERPGGNGAVRDFANYILQCRDIDPSILSPQ